jgi:hypothetical protein
MCGQLTAVAIAIMMRAHPDGACQFEKDIAYDGGVPLNNFAGSVTASAAECCNLCHATDKCGYFTHSGTTCALRSSSISYLGRSILLGAVSGISPQAPTSISTCRLEHSLSSEDQSHDISAATGSSYVWDSSTPNLPQKLGEVASGIVRNTLVTIGEGNSGTFGYDLVKQTWSRYSTRYVL